VSISNKKISAEDISTNFFVREAVMKNNQRHPQKYLDCQLLIVRRRKVPSTLAASIPLNAVWLRSANLRLILSEQVAISGTTWAIAGGMTAQSMYSI
jgi:hypothetical protein